MLDLWGCVEVVMGSPKRAKVFSIGRQQREGPQPGGEEMASPSIEGRSEDVIASV
jgi:hypothetical protein